MVEIEVIATMVGRALSEDEEVERAASLSVFIIITAEVRMRRRRGDMRKPTPIYLEDRRFELICDSVQVNEQVHKSNLSSCKRRVR